MPRIGNDWGQCDPNEPRNRRRRCSLLIESGAPDAIANGLRDQLTTVLVDCGPDMRAQLLDASVGYLDGVVVTHAHADHILGIDDLRQLWIKWQRRVDVYLDHSTLERLSRGFGYCFEQAPESSYPAFCNACLINSARSFEVEGAGGVVTLTPIQVEHGDIHALGLRIGDAVYLPDMKSMQLAASRELLNGIELLIVDALRYKSHPTHMSVDEALIFIESISPARAILTNMHGDLDYATLVNTLPAGVEPAFDGMSLTL